jgi:hypothetical protein
MVDGILAAEVISRDDTLVVTLKRTSTVQCDGSWAVVEYHSGELILGIREEDAVSRDHDSVLELLPILIRMTGLQIIHLIIICFIDDSVVLGFVQGWPDLIVIRDVVPQIVHPSPTASPTDPTWYRRTRSLTL